VWSEARHDAFAPGSFIADLDRDAAALIALWIEIYDGDPILAQVEVSPATAALAAAMVAQLRSEFTQSTGPLPDEELSARLGRLGSNLSGLSVPPARRSSAPPQDSCASGARRGNRVAA
jgi:hypothetical protein